MFSLRVPATSANLGPGFDALGVALDLVMEIDAKPSAEFSLDVSGRNADLIAGFESAGSNLILRTYRELAPGGPALALHVRNEIPIGMGCGSSAAALVAGVLLADHFGALGWSRDALLAEACRREGHPDNVAACMLGGLTVSSMTGTAVTTATIGIKLPWQLFLVLPKTGLATQEARALLPDSYTRADCVRNIQSTALLIAAFAQNRPELLAEGTKDCLHQPYRAGACPLLPLLLPLAGHREGIYSVTLSGAGPSVLLIASPEADGARVGGLIEAAAGHLSPEVAVCRIGMGATARTER